jgi:hypothetical protein
MTSTSRSAKPKIKLDLGCGDRKQDGFIGVDKYKTASTDKLVDLFKFPWPWKDGTVDEVHCSHFFEHVPAAVRPKFMDELHRILKKGAKATIICPYGGSVRSMQDYTHEWPPIFAESFLYFNKKWRTENKLTHGLYAMTCDFDFGYGFSLDADLVVRSNETQSYAMKHYFNAATDIQVTLTKR